VGAPARGDVEPLDPHGRRERRGKTVAAAAAVTANIRGAVAVVAAALVVKNPELQWRRVGGVALVEQEVGVVHERVVRARRWRSAEQRPAPVLVAVRFRRLGLAALLAL
jgi:hypothetical protein